MNLKSLALGATAGAFALALSSVPAAAATFPVGSPNFFLTSGTPASPSITAVFFNGFTSSTTFDDTFEFTIPQDGFGSGSISTSYSGDDTFLTITQLIVNGIPRFIAPPNGSGQSFTGAGIPIINGVKNTIRVIGFVEGSGSYAGTATFEAAVVPELTTWGLMIGGIGMVGVALRRRQGRLTLA